MPSKVDPLHRNVHQQNIIGHDLACLLTKDRALNETCSDSLGHVVGNYMFGIILCCPLFLFIFWSWISSLNVVSESNSS